MAPGSAVAHCRTATGPERPVRAPRRGPALTASASITCSGAAPRPPCRGPPSGMPSSSAHGSPLQAEGRLHLHTFVLSLERDCTAVHAARIRAYRNCGTRRRGPAPPVWPHCGKQHLDAATRGCARIRGSPGGFRISWCCDRNRSLAASGRVGLPRAPARPRADGQSSAVAMSPERRRSRRSR